MPLADRVWLWAGLVPLAGYLAVHLIAQASALRGPRAHAAWGSGVRAPFGAVFELVCVALPLCVYVGLGLRRFARARPVAHPPRTAADEAPEAVQEPSALGTSLDPFSLPLSGAVASIFLLLHLLEFRLPLWTGALAPSDYYPELCASLSSTRWGGIPVVAIGYLIGIAAASLHTALGLYRSGIELGLVGAQRTRLWAGSCRALGLGLFGLGALIVIDLATGSVLIQLPGS